MGQVSKQKKKYSKPSHPWQKERIIEEKRLLREYGLKNKKEIWKAQSLTKKATGQAKHITANKLSKQAQKEKEQFLTKLKKYDLIKNDAKIDDVLDLKTEDFLNKRLQTIIFKGGLARSVKQARQFIIHGHIFVNNRKVTVPSFLVTKDMIKKISFKPTSMLSKPDHPERMDTKTKKELKEKKENKIEAAVQEKPKEATVNG